jgi:alkanesulfonate monooxygenase SsuD/methylene tetrahydromethanopterin reductase-like flavin-dependent oxidoreductase (luciferase family)
VRVMAVPVSMATHGDVIVTASHSQDELARIRVIEATDYVEDVRARIKAVQTDGQQVTICMVYPPPGQPNILFISSAGTVVKLLDSEAGAAGCQPAP